MAPLVADVAGDGPSVVLLHGQPGVAANWWRVTAALRGRWRVVAPDRLGYGRTGGRAGDFAANAAAVVDLLDRLGIDRAAVAAHSWGGGVAMRLALDAPDRITAMVLVASVAPGAGAGRLDRFLSRHLLGEATALATLELPARLVGGDAAERAMRRMLPEAVWETVTNSSPGRGAWRSFAAEQRSLWSDLERLGDELGGVSVPTTVLAGGADRVVGPGAAARIGAAIPGARVVTIRGAGHLLPWEHPAEVAAALDRHRPEERSPGQG